MRTNVVLDDDLVRQAMRLTGAKTKRDVIQRALESLVAAATPLDLTGAFQPDHTPEIKTYDFFPVPVEEHSGVVTWSAPFRLKENAVPDGLSVKLRFDGQVCTDSGSCIPIQDREVEARFTG